MKISKELKSIIQRKLNAKRAEEETAASDANKALANKLNNELADSPEFKALFKAATEWSKKVNQVAEDNPDVVYLRSSRHGGNSDAWDVDDMLEHQNPKPLTYRFCSLANKYDDISDSIMMKLSYGQDFDEAQEMLATYGIEI